MYRDEAWYRKLDLAIRQRQDDFSDKQWKKFRVDHLLRVANRVRQTSEACETCQSYQHTLTRLEEEFAELPDSKAQRQYQSQQLQKMGKHFVKAHRLAPPSYFLHRWLRIGLIGGVLAGLIAATIVGDLLLLPGGVIVGGAAAGLYGWMLDQTYQREHRLI